MYHAAHKAGLDPPVYICGAYAKAHPQKMLEGDSGEEQEEQCPLLMQVATSCDLQGVQHPLCYLTDARYLVRDS